MRFFWTILLLFVVVGCRINKQTDDTVIADLIKKYPELTADSEGKFGLIKTLILPDNKATFRLYSLPLSTDYDNQIIVIINKQGQRRGIPLFHNSEAKYWHFEHDPENIRQKTVSLFEASFVDAINELGLNDSTGTGYEIFFHMMQSLLNCETLSEEEIPLLETHMVNGEAEDDESCKKRVAISKKLILKRMKSIIWNDVTQLNAFYEEQENRVFQVRFPEEKWGKIRHLHLRVYRFDERVTPIYM